jgi:hypothetical protein
VQEHVDQSDTMLRSPKPQLRTSNSETERSEGFIHTDICVLQSRYADRTCVCRYAEGGSILADMSVQETNMCVLQMYIQMCYKFVCSEGFIHTDTCVLPSRLEGLYSDLDLQRREV